MWWFKSTLGITLVLVAISYYNAAYGPKGAANVGPPLSVRAHSLRDPLTLENPLPEGSFSSLNSRAVGVSSGDLEGATGPENGSQIMTFQVELSDGSSMIILESISPETSSPTKTMEVGEVITIPVSGADIDVLEVPPDSFEQQAPVITGASWLRSIDNDLVPGGVLDVPEEQFLEDGASVRQVTGASQLELIDSDLDIYDVPF